MYRHAGSADTPGVTPPKIDVWDHARKDQRTCEEPSAMTTRDDVAAFNEAFLAALAAQDVDAS